MPAIQKACGTIPRALTYTLPDSYTFSLRSFCFEDIFMLRTLRQVSLRPVFLLLMLTVELLVELR